MRPLRKQSQTRTEIGFTLKESLSVCKLVLASHNSPPFGPLNTPEYVRKSGVWDQPRASAKTRETSSTDLSWSARTNKDKQGTAMDQ